MHELPDGGGVDLLGCRDEGDTTLLQIGHDDGIVDAVAGEAGQLVDDHVVNVAVAANAFEHLLEGDPLGHLGGGSSGFDVLGNDGDAELVCLALAGDPLRWDRDSLGVIVGIHLALGTHAQVGDGATSWRYIDSAEHQCNIG